MNILDVLNERRRQQGQSLSTQGFVPAIVVGYDGNRFVVNDGTHAVTCAFSFSGQLRPGDRVWIAHGKGFTSIIGFHGHDKDHLPR